jgi:type IV pilus assembly protein PilC
MPKFRYEGFDGNGKRIRGNLEAVDRRDVKVQMKRDGIRVVKIHEPGIMETDLDQLMIDAGLTKPFGIKELTKFTKQLYILLNSGVPILESFEILFKQEKNPRFKNIIKQIANDIGGGMTLHEALAKQKGFDKLYTSLVKAGESAGILVGILQQVWECVARNLRLLGEIKGALL